MINANIIIDFIGGCFPDFLIIGNYYKDSRVTDNIFIVFTVRRGDASYSFNYIDSVPYGFTINGSFYNFYDPDIFDSIVKQLGAEL